MAPSDGAAVVILKFNDYQCPGCGQTYRDYKPVLAKWAKQAPGKVKFITKDYPLETQCNQFVAQDLHLGACEAAVAVQARARKGQGRGDGRLAVCEPAGDESRQREKGGGQRSAASPTLTRASPARSSS